MKQVSTTWSKMSSEQKEMYKVKSDFDRKRFDLEKKQIKNQVKLDDKEEEK
jgi:hypothetical protein